MRPLEPMHRRPSAARRRGHFHTVALLVLFGALAWLADTDQPLPRVRPVDDAVSALQDGCRRPSLRSSEAARPGPCAVARLPER
jgi:hypothetical protein